MQTFKMGKKKSSVKYYKEKIDGFFRKCEHLEEFESILASILTLQKQLFWGIQKS
jgi:hypothetical protein